MPPDTERAWFHSARDSGEAFWRADNLRKARDGERFFNQPGGSWLREIWTIARLGIAVGADSVSLAPSDPPDGFLNRCNLTTPIEVTEAGDPSRRRGDEYRNGGPGTRAIGQAELSRIEREFPLWVANACQKKLEKERKKSALPIGTILCVHLSAFLHFTKVEAIWSGLSKIIPLPEYNIASIVVLHGSGCYFFDRMLSEEPIASFRQCEDTDLRSDEERLESLFSRP